MNPGRFRNKSDVHRSISNWHMQEPKYCSEVNCRYHFQPLSFDHFRRGPCYPQSHQSFERCSYCRGKDPISFQPSTIIPSPPSAKRKPCSRCKNTYSYLWFQGKDGRRCAVCYFCRNPERLQIFDSFNLIHKSRLDHPAKTLHHRQVQLLLLLPLKRLILLIKNMR